MEKKSIKASKRTTNDDVAISVKGVSKNFHIPHEKITSLRGAAVSLFKSSTMEEFKALDNVSFDVKKGEFFGIIGRNGSGKSTLLKILAGIYQADKGAVKVDGMISPFLELGIGFNPELSGRDNVYLNATVLGMTQKQIDEKFDDIVKFSELERFIDQKLKNYSSGMQVRLAFSVSIHANRDILLMDEVLAVGDSNFQSKCLEEFNKYRDMGRTVIIVTHDISVVQRYCDRAMLLRNGKIEKIGKADDVATQYIYDNMSDEEKRLANENDSVSKEIDDIAIESKKSKKIAEITKVAFLDKNGEEKNVFQTGDDVVIKVDFSFTKEQKYNFGVAIHDENGVYISGINTILDNIDTKKNVTAKSFIVYYKNIPLRENRYCVTVAIFGESDTKIYDFQKNIKSLQIYSNDTKQGIVLLNYGWK